MSAEATGYVFRFSPYRGAAFACHLAIADSVNDQYDNEFFMAQHRLAAKARVGRQTANESLRKMVDDGYLEVVEDGPHLCRGVVRYRFLFLRGDPTFDSRRVVSPDRNLSSRTTPDLSSPTTLIPTTPRTQEEPSPADAGSGEERVVDELGARAREIVVAHWERCKSESRPTPVLRSDKRSNSFIALAKIVERLLDAGWTGDQIGPALWSSSGGHTLQGLAVELTKRFPPEDIEPTSAPDRFHPRDCPVCAGTTWVYSEEDDRLTVRCPRFDPPE